ncbi:MAG: IclR family transcriptional regulator [Novosphingobium sp.]
MKIHSDPAKTAMETVSPELRPRVQSVARATAILAAIGNESTGMLPRDVSAAVGLSRPATYHLLHTLAQVGLVSRTPDGRYVLGLRIGTLAEAFRRQMAEGPQLSALLRDIARQSGEALSVTKWINGEAVVIDVVQGNHPIQAIQVPHGFSQDSFARAGGKLLLANAPDQQRSLYFATHALKKRTPHTATSIQELEQQFAQIRKVGFAIDRNEFVDGVSCLAVPVPQGVSPYAVTISAPSDRFEGEWQKYLAILRETIGSYFPV